MMYLSSLKKGNNHSDKRMLLLPQPNHKAK